MDCRLKEFEHIIFAMDHYNPLGLVRSLGEAGLSPIMIAEKSRTNISSFSKYIKEYLPVETVQDGYELLIERFSQEGTKPFLYTCDDRTISYLDERYDEWKEYFIGFNAGKTGQISKYMDKYRILEMAKKYGLKTLNTVCVDKGVIPPNIDYPVITKSISPVVGGWKSDVHICFSELDLMAAYARIKANKVIIQKYIDKKNEYCIDGFCAQKGTVMFNSIETQYNYLIPGYYSPFMTIKNFYNPDIETSLRQMMEEIGFEGIFSIEFLIDKDNQLYFSEINFRNSTWSYASTCAGMNLPVLWAKTMLGEPIPKNAQKMIEKNFTAMVEPIDFEKRVVSGKTELGDWLKDFKEAQCPFYYSKEDIEPFLYMCQNWKSLS